MPYRHGNLWKHIVEKSNIEIAIQKLIPYPAENNPRRLTQEEIYILEHRQDVIEDIHNQLVTHSYKFGEVKCFIRREGRKIREIHYLPKTGSLLLQCVQNVVQPIFVEKYIHQTYSSIKGRGGAKMESDIIRTIITHPEYDRVITVDAKKCYDSVDHQIMMRCLEHSIKDKYVLDFYHQMIELMEPGVAIGFLPNHYLVNLLFTALDHSMKEMHHCVAYFRYMDDILILCKIVDEVRILNAIKIEFDKISMTMKNTLRLDWLKNGIDFCGIVYFPNGHTRLRKSIVLNAKRLDMSLRKEQVSPEEYKRRMASYHGWLLMVDGKHLMHTIYKDYYDLFFTKKKKRDMEAIRLSEVKTKWFGMEHDRFISSYIDNDKRLYENDFIVMALQDAEFDGEVGIVVRLMLDNEEFYTITKSTSLVPRFKKAWEKVGGQPFVTRMQLQASRTNPRRKYPVLI